MVSQNHAHSLDGGVKVYRSRPAFGDSVKGSAERCNRRIGQRIAESVDCQDGAVCGSDADQRGAPNGQTLHTSDENGGIVGRDPHLPFWKLSLVEETHGPVFPHYRPHNLLPFIESGKFHERPVSVLDLEVGELTKAVYAESFHTKGGESATIDDRTFEVSVGHVIRFGKPSDESSGEGIAGSRRVIDVLERVSGSRKDRVFRDEERAVFPLLNNDDSWTHRSNHLRRPDQIRFLCE